MGRNGTGSGVEKVRRFALNVPATGELVERVDRYADSLRKATPGLVITRCDVVRIALEKVLSEFEAGAVK